MSGTTSKNGIDNDNKTISGVAGTDAANVDQLHEMASSLTTVNDDRPRSTATRAWSTPTRQCSQTTDASSMRRRPSSTRAGAADNRKVASTGVAAAVAIGSISALDTGKRVGVGLGVGTDDGRPAVAMAVAARVSDALQVRFNLGTGNDGRMAARVAGNCAWKMVQRRRWFASRRRCNGEVVQHKCEKSAYLYEEMSIN